MPVNTVLYFGFSPSTITNGIPCISCLYIFLQTDHLHPDG
ncbi:hypothetical protein Dm11a5_1222 [Dehalococcoides mccartyi]|uniref:Uncharacterized protein n=1 Tax=Dehalococcoides mccartyi TaxID=61435 RepID=A0A142VB60_9CHLR|nr:hypothetical protein Dm11a5_1222 [Dehalococcoides mccartyi]